MPKSKAKRKSKSAGARREASIPWGGQSGSRAHKGDRRINLILAAVAIALVAAGVVYWAQTAQAERAFQAMVEQGQDRLAAAVASDPDRGRGHGAHGATYVYGVQFPTSGRHDPVPTAPGVYRVPLRPGQLVHALEHGNIVAYYDVPAEEALETLKDWAGHYSGQWDGLVVAPMEGLGGEVVLTAWTKRLHLLSFDAPLAAAFIDAYRGRGPENPVR